MAPGARGARPVVSPTRHSTSTSPAREPLSSHKRQEGPTGHLRRDARSAATAPGATEPHGHTFLKRFSSGLGQTPCLSPLKLVKAESCPSVPGRPELCPQPGPRGHCDGEHGGQQARSRSEWGHGHLSCKRTTTNPAPVYVQLRAPGRGRLGRKGPATRTPPPTGSSRCPKDHVTQPVSSPGQVRTIKEMFSVKAPTSQG